METRQQRKSKAVDALKKTSNDPRVIVVTARMFWTERNITKARAWFEKAVNANKDLGEQCHVFPFWINAEEAHRRLMGVVAQVREAARHARSARSGRGKVHHR
jgi:pre-mRNA-processing factor 6